MVIAPHGSLAAEAAAHIAGSGENIPRSRGDAHEIRKQAAQLCEWAKQTGHLIDYSPPPDAPKSKGVEHEVFFHLSVNRVFKRTHPGTFGSAPTERGLRRTATPYFYLCRIILVNEVFGSDIQFEGVIGGDNASVVISQPWAHPADQNSPSPSSEEIYDFMTKLNFEPVADSPYDWIRKSEGILVSDARPDNFMKTPDGIIPIDVVICKD